MAEKGEKDAESAEVRAHLIGVTAVIVAIVLIIYGVSIFAGGKFYDFCREAIGWVLAGIVIAAYFVHWSQKENAVKDKAWK